MILEQHGYWVTDPHIVENLFITYSQPVVSIHSSSVYIGSFNHESYSTLVFTIKKPSYKWPVLFIPVLFKTHLYFKTGYSKSDIFFTFSILVVLVFCFFLRILLDFPNGEQAFLNFFFFFDSPINVKSTLILKVRVYKRKLFYIVTDIHLAQGLSS